MAVFGDTARGLSVTQMSRSWLQRTLDVPQMSHLAEVADWRYSATRRGGSFPVLPRSYTVMQLSFDLVYMMCLAASTTICATATLAGSLGHSLNTDGTRSPRPPVTHTFVQRFSRQPAPLLYVISYRCPSRPPQKMRPKGVELMHDMQTLSEGIV
jgi:hypothetical protein